MNDADRQVPLNSADANALGDQPNRRSFMSVLSSIAMALGLTTGYGAFAAFAARFLFPSKGSETSQMFVTTVSSVDLGQTVAYQAPGGQSITVARLRENGDADDFVALSGICPHLGCQVHWEPHKDRFFCPCHNGAFNPEGAPTEGPPKDAGQSLSRYPLSIENGMLFIEVPTALPV